MTGTDRDTDTQTDTDIDAAEYVLHLLGPEANRHFEAQLGQDAGRREDVRLWAERLSGLAPAPVAPPPAVRKRLMTRLFPSKTPPGWSRLDLWRGIALASVAMAAAILWYDRPSQRAVTISEMRAEDGMLHAIAIRRSGTEGVRIVHSGVPVQPGFDREIWLIASGKAPVSLGLLPTGGRVLLPLPPGIALADELTLAISREPEGGSPTGAPTGPVLATGAFGRL